MYDPKAPLSSSKVQFMAIEILSACEEARIAFGRLVFPESLMPYVHVV